MSRRWPLTARWFDALLALLLPGPVHAGLVRDLDEGFRSRVDAGVAANRWLRRQLLLTLRPSRLRDLRAIPARELGGADDVGALTAIGRMLGLAVMDLRYSLRLLLRSPGFSLMTAVILTGGLSVSIFTYSFMYTVLHKPLPLPAGDGVVRVMAVDGGRSVLTDGDVYEFIRRNNQSFEHVGAYVTLPVLLRGGDEPRSSYGTYVEPNMFDVAQVQPSHGRRLVAADALPGAEPVMVLSHHVWTTAFGADPAILDSLVEVNAQGTRVVGIMPEGFGFPVFGHLWLPAEADLLNPADGTPNAVQAYGLLREGVSSERADVEMHELMQRYRATIESAEVLERTPPSARTRTFQMAQLGDEAQLVYSLVHLASTFILLLAGVNAANMLLARTLERAREITIRVAIGAPRARLVTQMMGEGVLLTILATTAATAIAAQALSFFDARARAALPEGLAYWWNWGLDGRTVMAASFLALMTMLVVGGVPAWRVVRADTNAALRDGQQGGASLSGDRLARSLVVVQIAAIAVLLFLGGITGYVAQMAGNVDLGFETENVLVGSVSLGVDDYPTVEARADVLARVASAVESDSSVTAVLVRGLLSRGETRIGIEGLEYDRAADQPTVTMRAHMGDPAAIGLELESGRFFDERDGTGGPGGVLVSASLARKLWPDQNPLGRRLRVGSVEDPATEEAPWRTVVGVVSDVLEGNPLSRDRNSDTLYLSMRAVGPTFARFAFKHRGDPRPAIAGFYAALATQGPTLEAQRIEDFDQMIDQIQGMSRAASQALTGAFGFALLLAIGGIYGLTSRSVTQRTQEIGIRRALGATNARIVRLFLRGGGRQLVIGLGAAGLIAGVGTSAVLRFMEIDMLALAIVGVGVPALISALVLLATYVPTRRAVQLNPRSAIWRE